MTYNSGDNWNFGKKYNISVPTDFSKIETARELVMYLDDFTARTKKYRYIYHYTTLKNLIKILSGGYWHLANPKEMNDQLEYQHGNSERWEHIFFASFMMDSKESIGMWSMYSQPWETGVKIALPISAVKEWIRKTPDLYPVIKDENGNYRIIKSPISISDNEATLKLSSVAYSNADSLETSKQEKCLSWSTAINTIIKDAYDSPQLTGYIKDKAWDYEKEIRLKAVIPSECNFDRIAIEVPQDLINSMIITTSPLFKGDLQDKIREEIEFQVKAVPSIFSGRLQNIKTICSDCKFEFRPREESSSQIVEREAVSV